MLTKQIYYIKCETWLLLLIKSSFFGQEASEDQGSDHVQVLAITITINTNNSNNNNNSKTSNHQSAFTPNNIYRTRNNLRNRCLNIYNSNHLQFRRPLRINHSQACQVRVLKIIYLFIIKFIVNCNVSYISNYSFKM